MKIEENMKELEIQEIRKEGRWAGGTRTSGQTDVREGRSQTADRDQPGGRQTGVPCGRNRTPGQARTASRRSRNQASQASEPVKRGKSMPVILVAAAVFSALASMAAAYFYFQGKSKSKEPTGLVYEANIIQGDISGKTKEERQRELDAIVEEGMLAMSINATPSGKTTGADRTINWLIENPSNQGKLIRVEIWRDDTDEKIYETGAIPPGNYVEAAPLKAELPPGEYRCTARFYAYSQEDESYIGQAAAQIRLVLYE